jgi:hypothetical protein
LNARQSICDARHTKWMTAGISGYRKSMKEVGRNCHILAPLP